MKGSVFIIIIIIIIYCALHENRGCLCLFESAILAHGVFMVFCVLRVFGFIWVVLHYWGFLWIQSSYVGHDSGHYQIMSNPRFNKLAQILVGNCITGISIAWWNLDYDPDLQHIPMFVVSFSLFNSIKSIFYGRILKFDSIARFLYPFFVSCLPDWGERVMFVLASMAVTSIQHIQFTLNLFLANVYVGPPSGNDWFEKQTSGTIDISCSTWMDWFHEWCHLRSISPLVKDLCKKYNLPYRGLSFREANVSTIRTLRTTVLQARDLTNPVPKNLVWEVANIHG
ncbi:hypothetical protein PVL29_024688 [Vitis rotundifolia]|uniref:Uncharacterized protein n=1 Tax=Vitis rotundifolia TaxID=103349 RepID=A0AA38YSW0_VITRO|nr:hypothetical protein PVL29_024688 [Vitis rotundifolia]